MIIIKRPVSFGDRGSVKRLRPRSGFGIIIITGIILSRVYNRILLLTDNGSKIVSSSILRISHNASPSRSEMAAGARKLNAFAGKKKGGLADARSRVRLIMADYLRHLTARIRMLYLSRSFPRFRRAALKYSCAASSQNGLSRSRVPVNIMVMSAKRISIQFRYLARVSQQIMRAFVKAGKINVYCQYSHIDSTNQSSDEFRRIAKIITRHDLARYFRPDDSSVDGSLLSGTNVDLPERFST